MGWPQWVIIGIFLFGLGITAAKHGESSSRYNFWVSLISNGLIIWLLWMGGFFS